MYELAQLGPWLALALCLAAAATDIAWRRVPNWLTVPAAVAGLVLATAASGVHGLLASAAGLALGLSVGIAAMALGAPFGGGDTKLLAAMGALAGPAFVASAALYGALAGGPLAVAQALRRGRLKQSINAIVTFVAASAGRAKPIRLEAVSTGLTVPFAVALAAGAAAAALLPPPWALLQ